MSKKRVGILGATGIVGQRFITLLNKHPWFSVTCVAASEQSAGKEYRTVVENRWKMEEKIPKSIGSLRVLSVEKDAKIIAENVDLVFSALAMEKEAIQHIEELYASLGIPVISSNSAHRWTDDIPMIIPEVNGDHLSLIDIQRKKRGWQKGCIVVKPNCSIQSYVTVLTALRSLQPETVEVVSLQAVSGAGKTLKTWPEMMDNVIPFIAGEEEKSEMEPLKIWGKIQNGKMNSAVLPAIAATCIRVPVSNGHMAHVSVNFRKIPTITEIRLHIQQFNHNHATVQDALPSGANPLITYYEDLSRPQTKTDRMYERGMGVVMGRLRKAKHFQYSFITLSHNTIRGAAGGAILTAELMVKKQYIQ